MAKLPSSLLNRRKADDEAGAGGPIFAVLHVNFPVVALTIAWAMARPRRSDDRNSLLRADGMKAVENRLASLGRDARAFIFDADADLVVSDQR